MSAAPIATPNIPLPGIDALLASLTVTPPQTTSFLNVIAPMMSSSPQPRSTDSSLPAAIAQPQQIAQALIQSMLTVSPTQTPLKKAKDTNTTEEQDPQPTAVPAQAAFIQAAFIPIQIAPQTPINFVTIPIPAEQAASLQIKLQPKPQVASVPSAPSAPLAFALRLAPANPAPTTPSDEQPATVVLDPAAALPQAPQDPDPQTPSKATPATPTAPSLPAPSKRDRENPPASPAQPATTQSATDVTMPMVVRPEAPQVTIVTNRAAMQSDSPAPSARPQELSSTPAFHEVATPRTAQEIAVRISRPDSPAVDLHLAQRGAEIRVAVRTPDGPLQTSLRQDLGTLVNSLARAGFRAESASPAQHISAIAASDLQFANSEANQNSSSQDDLSGQTGHRDSRQSQDNPDSQHQRRHNAQRWFELMEDAA